MNGFFFFFYSVIENFWEIDFLFFIGLVAELGFVGGKWGLWNCELNK